MQVLGLPIRVSTLPDYRVLLPRGVCKEVVDSADHGKLQGGCVPRLGGFISYRQTWRRGPVAVVAICQKCLIQQRRLC